MTVPSAREVTAENRFATGAFDLRIVSGVPPAFPTVKLRVMVWPIAPCGSAGQEACASSFARTDRAAAAWSLANTV